MGYRELEVIRKAKQLRTHTLVITSNPKTYPKKYRHSLVFDMQNTSMNIIRFLREANRTKMDVNKEGRLELQTEAIWSCDDLLDLIELSFELHLISKKRLEYWSKSVKDVKHMTIAWRSSDSKR